jgi:16S rRNA processing protein RimM
MASGGASEEQVLVGEIAAPHGLRGEIKMRPLMERPETLSTLPAVWLRFPDGREERRRVTSARVQQKQALLTIAGVPDRSAAEALRGAQIWIRRDQLPDLPADTYYEADLVGLSVVTEAGRDLGSIVQVHFYPSGNDVYETELAMIPAIGDVVVSVDIPARRMIVRDVAGLRKDE